MIVGFFSFAAGEKLFGWVKRNSLNLGCSAVQTLLSDGKAAKNGRSLSFFQPVPGWHRRCYW